jgi:hypothetical protein
MKAKGSENPIKSMKSNFTPHLLSDPFHGGNFHQIKGGAFSF